MRHAWTPKFQLSGPTVHSYTVTVPATLGSPKINGKYIFYLMNMYIHVCIIYACGMNCTQSPTVLITHGKPS